MTAAIGYPTLRLIRPAVGFSRLRDYRRNLAGDRVDSRALKAYLPEERLPHESKFILLTASVVLAMMGLPSSDPRAAEDPSAPVTSSSTPAPRVKQAVPGQKKSAARETRKQKARRTR